MKIVKFTIGHFEVNNYLVYDEETKKAVLIDAGEDTIPILKKIEERQLELVYLINTHGHADHIAGNGNIVEKTGAKLLIHPDEKPFLQDPQLNLSAHLGFELRSPKPDKLVNEKDLIEVGDIKFEVKYTPGHSPGHITLIYQKHAFVGDVIFRGSIGRTDLPYASNQSLINSIQNIIYSLPEETILYPGHGPNTTVGEEKNNNPFVSV
jgi:glyoxylase-like metal-dependent hydrolase (beta-lactamase superfamily II)